MIELPPEAWEALRLSLKVSIVATVLSLPVAIWVAHILARGRFRGRGLLDALVHLPLVLPPVVTGYALLLLFSRSGPLGAVLEPLGLGLAFRWTGAALAAAIMGFPLIVRAIRLAFEAVDPRLEEAGATLGFAKAFGEFGATITFVASIPGETRTLPSAIYAFLQVPDGGAGLRGLVAIAVVVAVGAVLVSNWLAPRIAARVAGR